MGSIHPYDTAKGRRYRVRYRTPDRRQAEKKGFATKRDATAYLATVEVSKLRGEYIDPRDSRATVRTLSKAWLAAKEATLKPSSYTPLDAAWRNYVEPRWGDVEVGQVRMSEVQAWSAAIDMSATVVLRAHGILAGILDVAVRDRRIAANPARGIDLPKKRGRKERRRYLTHEQLVELADNSGKHRTLVLTLGWCGPRWSEAIELRTGDLDFKRRRIHISRAAVEVGGRIHIGTTKGDETRTVPMPEALAFLLRAQCKDKGADQLVFADMHGEHMRRVRSSEGSRSWFKTALAASGIEPLDLHDLRHTAASLAVASGANVKAVQRMLGHSSAAMTLDVYADLFDDDLEAPGARFDAVIAQKFVGKLWANAAAS